MLRCRSVLLLYDLVFIARLKERAGSRAAGKIAGHLVLVQTAALSTVPAAVLVLHIVQADLAGSFIAFAFLCSLGGSLGLGRFAGLTLEDLRLDPCHAGGVRVLAGDQALILMPIR